MKMHKSIQADSAGRINLGKTCAGAFFIFSKENNKIILEPAKILSEQEIAQKEKEHKKEQLLLNEKEWKLFEKIMEQDEQPTKKLQRLMQHEG